MRSRLRALDTFLGTKKTAHIVVCPPAVFVADAARHAEKKKRFTVGVQHIHGEADGAHTGDVSAQQVASVGARVAIVGHAERRALGETNADTAKQMFMAVTTGLTPVLCVGEKERDHHGAFLKVVSQQITEGLALVPQHLRGKVIIAYEPVYAIGAPKPPKEVDIHHMVLAIRKTLIQAYGMPVARNVAILYGGAVDSTNIQAIRTTIPELGGFLIGRASVDPEKFHALLTAIS